MVERAEGFWWVRWEGGEVWRIAELVGPTLRVMAPSADTYHFDRDVAGIVWGDYLGKSPADLRKRFAQWVRDHAQDESYWLVNDEGPASFNEHALAEAIEKG